MRRPEHFFVCKLASDTVCMKNFCFYILFVGPVSFKKLKGDEVCVKSLYTSTVCNIFVGGNFSFAYLLKGMHFRILDKPKWAKCIVLYLFQISSYLHGVNRWRASVAHSVNLWSDFTHWSFILFWNIFHINIKIFENIRYFSV